MKKIKFSNDSSKNDRLAENAIRKNFNKKDIIKMCDVLYKNKNSKEFFKMTKNLEGESYEELVESNILEICEEYDFEEKAKPKGKAKAKDSEELQELSKFKKKSGDKETTDSFISAIEKRQKEDEAKMDELKKERAKETQRLIKALEAQRAQQAETESEDEPDEIPYKDFKLIEGVPKNIKRIFYDYVDDRTGYANAENQKGEIEELQRIEKNYIQAEATRKNKSESAKNQLKAVQTIGSILIEVRNDINDNPDIKKLYRIYTPVILKRVLDQKKKDEADLKKEAEEIKKQEKADEKEFKKSLKEEKKKSKD